MATWQFDVDLIPLGEIQRVYGKVPAHLDREAFNAGDWWRNFPPPANYREMLSAFAPAGLSWSEHIELWGDMAGDRVEVTYDADKIDAVAVSANIRDLNQAFINGVAKFAQECNCLIFTEHGELLEPTVESLAKAILESSALRFVDNPRDFPHHRLILNPP